MADQEYRDRDQQHADDQEVGVAAQTMGDGPDDTLAGGVPLYPPVACLVEPGESDGHRKAEHCGDDQRDHHPFRHAERLEGDVGNLQQQPGDHGIARRDADHAPLAQAMQPGGAGGVRHMCTAAYGLGIAPA